MKRWKKGKYKNCKRKGKLQAILTVELAYLFIVLLSMFIMIIHAIFYYHDKNILQGAASETAVLWAQLERRQEDYKEMSAETFCQNRINGKLILFSSVSVSAAQSDEEIDVTVSAEKGFMKVSVRGTAAVVKPEDKIRKKRLIQNWMDQ